MRQADAMKGEVVLKWFENGAFSFQLPTDAAIAYAMLHFALDEIQERLRATKHKNLTQEQLAVVPNDGNAPVRQWGR